MRCLEQCLAHMPATVVLAATGIIVDFGLPETVLTCAVPSRHVKVHDLSWAQVP